MMCAVNNQKCLNCIHSHIMKSYPHERICDNPTAKISFEVPDDWYCGDFKEKLDKTTESEKNE